MKIIAYGSISTNNTTMKWDREGVTNIIVILGRHKQQKRTEKSTAPNQTFYVPIILNEIKILFRFYR